ncbi:sigma-70 family RNA polymerase sigma factor [Elizabethkingia argentiflava]|uniref:Sigma-70 family RNA polymerase sigma factor n=1 Tax=Elizabethkingia argenteiflava TaxID=2681556 RepID=A0A845Q0Q3_9FLAO|nr:sigma-70 family RNA polymerase sigma factor [Elizabethkingia argenteiflava]NAW52267.1 sigma-70 family RNA polymerase sigma factor [Elizabethkingia argenteiflava]
MNEKILKQCSRNNRIAQRKLYDVYYPKLHFVCKRYLTSPEDIEEVLADSFYHILSKISQLKEWKAFDAWSRKITVNQCLNFLRTKYTPVISMEDYTRRLVHPLQDFPYNEQELLHLMETLPPGSKTIFNLYAIEGYSHKEIAAQLGISEGTSKSQLNFAKKKLQKLVHQFYFSKTF